MPYLSSKEQVTWNKDIPFLLPSQKKNSRYHQIFLSKIKTIETNQIIEPLKIYCDYHTHSISFRNN